MIHWRNAAHRVAYWTVPPGFRDLLRPMLASCLLTAEERALLEKNRVLQNLHLGQRCFILATGPSIKTQDLKALQGETCIAVSNFFVHQDYDLIRPRYHCVAPYHPPLMEDAWQRWMDEMEAATANATMFFGMTDLERNRRGGRFANREMFFLRFGMDFRLLRDSGIDLTRPVPAPQSVPIMAIMIAMYMGCREIYLLGVELDELWCGEYKHFYDDEILRNIKAVNEDGKSITPLIEMFRINYILWQQFDILRRIAEANNIEILNATQGGALDVYRRVNFEELFDE